MKTIIVKETVTNKSNIGKATKEAIKSNAVEGTTSVGILFRKIKSTLILL